MRNNNRLPRKTTLALAVAAVATGMVSSAGATVPTCTNISGSIPASIVWTTGDCTVTSTGNITSTTGNGVSVNSGVTVGTLTNGGTISGNIGVSNSGTVTSVTNNGSILGGGVTALYNSGSIGTLTNNGTITDGDIYVPGGTITSLVNNGTIQGTTAWVGINNQATITSLTNNAGGTINGGSGGIMNTGTIGTLTNGGVISGTAAITNYGTLGPITNSGTIAGNIVNNAANDLTINGATGSAFGTLEGYSSAVGTISNSSSNLIFGSGNLVLSDNINVGSNSVNNVGATLRVNAPMTITGNYSQGAGAALLIGVGSGAVTTGSLTSDSGYGRLVVSGNASIDSGSSVGLTSREYAFASGQRYVVVDAAGTGTYHADSLVYSASGFSGTVTGQQVTDGGHSDLVLTLTGAPTSTPTAIAPTVPNAISSINGLSRYTGLSAGLLNLYNASLALGTGTTAEANRAGVQLDPVQPSSASHAAAAPTFDVLDIIASHSNGLRLAQDGSQTGIATGDAAPQWGVWGQAFGGHAAQGDTDQESGYSANYGGLLIGVDRAVNDRWRVGGVFNYSNTAVNDTGDAAGDSTRVNSYGLVGYASYAGTPWYVNLSAGIVQQRYDSTREISLTGFSGVANGQFNGQQYVASAEFGYPLALGPATLTPIASLTYSYQHLGAYVETGGNGAALSVDASHATSVRSNIGFKLDKAFSTAYGEVVPSVQAQWLHEYDHTRMVTGASFAADPTGATAFTTVGQAPVSDLADISLGATLLRANNLSLTLRYEIQAGARFVSQTGSLRLRQLF